jgi:Zn-dependent protease/CBS domain-containing protein
MSASLKLGRIAGIEVGLNWSLFIVFFLIAAGLAGQELPADAPGYSAGAYTVAALAAVVLFYASLLAHELGHAVMARRLGTRVEGITLWLFGGVARLAGESTSESAELRITLIGPVITVLVAIGFALLGAGVLTVNGSPLVAEVFGWLARINFLLAAFNLIPAFPLDGGRVLRAILWRVMHNQARATSIAAALGRGFGVVLVLAGVGEAFFLGSFVNGLWLGFLGWFLFQAAGSQQLETRVQRSFDGLFVRDVMTPDPATAPDWTSVEDFVGRVASIHQASAYPVRDFQGELTGLVSRGDLAAVPAAARSATQVRAIARPISQLAIARPDEPVINALIRAGSAGARYILVMDGDYLAGLLALEDLDSRVEVTRPGRPSTSFSPSR